MNTSAVRQECATLIIFVHYVRKELQADAAPMLWFTDSKIPRSTGEERFTWTRMIRGPTISNTWYFCQQTLLGALIVTGRSDSCFGEQYRDLLRYLHQKLDENNSNQQEVHIMPVAPVAQR